METLQKLPFDLSLIAQVFDIKHQKKCTHLEEWLSSVYSLSSEEHYLFEKIFQEIEEDGDYWNEEELKIKAVGSLFLIANIAVKDRIKVFYERPLSTEKNGYRLSVVTDCMVATPLLFNSPNVPYFFLQEFKKGKGEKKDPEAQMLMAMLIAQHLNNDEKPLYGGFLVGTDWRFATLIGNHYCLSPKIDAAKKPELLQIIYILRKLKELILNR